MDQVLAVAGPLGALGASAAWLTHMSVNGLTMAWPRRPAVAGWLAALAFGIFYMILLAAASLPLEDAWTRQTWAQIILAGLSAGIGGAGSSLIQASAENRRAVAKNQDAASGVPSDGEPDPVTPEARPHA